VTSPKYFVFAYKGTMIINSQNHIIYAVSFEKTPCYNDKYTKISKDWILNVDISKQLRMA